jgi:hypothetical protein
MRIDVAQEIGFYRQMMRLLGNPMHLNFWLDEDKHVLLVSAAEEPTDFSVPMPEQFYTRSNGPRLKNRRLQRLLGGLCGDGNSAVYRLRGEFVPSLNMVAFRLENAEKEVSV